jgi:excisionase family DNA binding protein
MQKDVEMSKVNPASNAKAEIALLQRFESDLLTRDQAAAYLGIATRTLAIWKWAKRYDLPYVKIGRLVRYKRSDLDAFIRRHSSGEGNAG